MNSKRAARSPSPFLLRLQGLRGALNAVLFRTGDQSRDFALVLATNRPGDLDAAVLDRMDESLEFGLPGLNERRNILSQYVDQYIVKAGTAAGGAGAASDTGLWRRLSVGPQVPCTSSVSCHSVSFPFALSVVSICRLSFLVFGPRHYFPSLAVPLPGSDLSYDFPLAHVISSTGTAENTQDAAVPVLVVSITMSLS